MKKPFSFVLVFVSVLLHPSQAAAQETSKGINFETNLNWREILQKAAKEHRFIFVDCYTTWCAPCKMMDKEIFPNPKVGQFMNEHFISVRIQMDKTYQDSARVKDWYEEAAKFATDYHVTAYPTFLFFSPEGKPLHRKAGGYPPGQFIQLAKDAMDPAKQYYIMLGDYRPDGMSVKDLKEKALSLRYNGPELAPQIALDYLKRLNQAELTSRETLRFAAVFPDLEKTQEIGKTYLATLTPSNLDDRFNQAIVASFQKVLPEAVKLADAYINSLAEKDAQDEKTITFIVEMMHSTESSGFRYFYKYAEDVDKEFGKGYAEGFIIGIIAKEYIEPDLDSAATQNGLEPEWNKMHSEITAKFNSWYANSCVSLSKCQFAKSHEVAFANEVLFFDTYGHGRNGEEKRGAFDLNMAAWGVFTRINDPAELKIALAWSKRATEQEPYNPANVDTYANLLYKLGNKDQAVGLEAIAARIDPTNKDIQMTLEKMKASVPTWTGSGEANK